LGFLGEKFHEAAFAYLIIGSLWGSGVIVQTALAATPSFRSTLEDHLVAVSHATWTRYCLR
jgi:hypothetical protein